MTETEIDIVRDNLKAAIALLGLKQSRISLEAGLSKNALGSFLTGRTSLSHENLLRICRVLQMPIGLLNRPGGITRERIELHRALAELPDHEIVRILEAAPSQ